MENEAACYKQTQPVSKWERGKPGKTALAFRFHNQGKAIPPKGTIKELKYKPLEQQFQTKLKSRFQLLYHPSPSQEGTMNTSQSIWHGNIIGMIELQLAPIQKRKQQKTEVKGKKKCVDNTANEVEVVAERSKSKSLYRLKKVTVSQFTQSGNVVSSKQKKL